MDDAKYVAQLCALVMDEAEAKHDERYEDIYSILWEKGIALCNGRALEFYRLCEDALKDAPGVPS